MHRSPPFVAVTATADDVRDRTLETMKRKAAKKHFARTTSSGPTRIVNITQLGDVVNLKARRLYMLRHEGMPQISPRDTER
jgi:hypothetical protein